MERKVTGILYDSEQADKILRGTGEGSTFLQVLEFEKREKVWRPEQNNYKGRLADRVIEISH